MNEYLTAHVASACLHGGTSDALARHHIGNKGCLSMKPIAMALALLLAAGTPVLAQAPARNGNVWNGRSHEPDPGLVQQNEQSAGVALSPGQRQQENAVVEQEAKKLLQRAQPATPGTAQPPAR